MEDILKAIFSQYGALGFGWILAGILLRKVFVDENKNRSVIEKNTIAITKMTVLLTERLPRGGANDHV